tara:strand:- start:7103 stop:8068 length:966 start_codon:yes stop_codon:yes gene_type:complete
MMNDLDQDAFFNGFKVAAFYCFSFVEEELITSILQEINLLASNSNIKGMVLFAPEGINGTICGSPEEIRSFFEKIKPIISGNNCEKKYSWCKKQAFRRFRARRKNEIVTMGIKEINPNECSGNYVEPLEWNELIDDPDTLVVDTRNEYEIAVGTFKGALNPHTDTFGDFPNWVENTLRPLVEERKPKNIAMFCTGGIRCEKATSYLKKEGFTGVNHLHGGILKYLEEVPKAESRWEGECFVFDRRVALNHDLVPGVFRLCNACGMPLSPEDRKRNSYVRGIKCHYCESHFTDQDRSRFAERQKYIDDLSKRLPGNSFWPTL